MSETVTTEKPSEKPEAFSARSVRPNGRERDVEVEPVGPPKTVIREYFESAVVTVIMALFGMTFIVQAVKVPTASMENTITVGDHLLVNKFIFAPGPTFPLLPQREIKRGDNYLGQYNRNWFDFAHFYLWEGLIVLDTLAIFWLWAVVVRRSGAGAECLGRLVRKPGF